MIRNKQRISLDFDGVLGHEAWVQEMAKGLMKDGHNEVHIITRRYDSIINGIDEVSEVLQIADYLKIPKKRIHFLNREYKFNKIKELNINIHFDDDIIEIIQIRSKCPECRAILVS